MKTYLLIIYIGFYWLFGSLYYIAAFGLDEFIRSFWAPINRGMWSGTVILFSSLAASCIIFYFKKETLKNQPYPYFIFGFYVGHLALIILFLIDNFFNKLIVWKFPNFLFMFLAPFIELIAGYLFGFPFLSVIPALGAVFFLYWINKASYE